MVYSPSTTSEWPTTILAAGLHSQSTVANFLGPTETTDR
jgi:hypothetical protein